MDCLLMLVLGDIGGCGKEFYLLAITEIVYK